MKLLVSQKNELYDQIEESGLSPAMFEFKEASSKIVPKQIATILVLKNSEFYFSFETGLKSISSHYTIFSPGRGSITETQSPGSWSTQFVYFQNWLTYLQREISAPNKWERLSKEITEIKIPLSSDESKFTAYEFDNLKYRINLLKTNLEQIGLEPEQISSIYNKLDHLLDLAKEMNKFDWKSLFVGTFVSIIIQLSISPELGRMIWELIKHFFNNFLLP